MAETTATTPSETTPVEVPVEEVPKTEENGQNGKSAEPVHDAELNKKIVQQIEYYFGDYNLPRDKFLGVEVKKDDGWITMETMLKFARLAKLTTDASVIIAALKEADTFMEVDPSDSKIRRSTSAPLPELTEGLKEESIARTVYCKGFAKDGSVTLDLLLEFFKQFGEYDAVRMRNYVDKTSSAQGFKGSVLVVFKTAELAEKFLTGPPVQYKKTYLIRKMFGDYLEEKRQEIEDRRAKKAAKLEENKSANGRGDFAELPRGVFLRATGFAEGTAREDIKEAVNDLTGDCAFVDFKKGDEQAYLRFKEADCNKKILAALEGNLVVKDAKLSVFLVEGEEEDEQLKKGNEALRRSISAGGQGKKRKTGGYGGRGGKRQGRN